MIKKVVFNREENIFFKDIPKNSVVIGKSEWVYFILNMDKNGDYIWHALNKNPSYVTLTFKTQDEALLFASCFDTLHYFDSYITAHYWIKDNIKRNNNLKPKYHSHASVNEKIKSGHICDNCRWSDCSADSFYCLECCSNQCHFIFAKETGGLDDGTTAPT